MNLDPILDPDHALAIALGIAMVISVTIAKIKTRKQGS